MKDVTRLARLCCRMASGVVADVGEGYLRSWLGFVVEWLLGVVAMMEKLLARLCCRVALWFGGGR